MNKTIKLSLAFVGLSLFVFLLFAFSNAEIDPFKWRDEVRTMYSFVVVFIAWIVYGILKS